MSLTGLGLSDYMENAILAFFKGTTFPAAPTTLGIGLFTTNPADTGTTGGTADGTEMSTSNGTTGFSNYTRVSLTASSGWTAIAAATGDSTGQMIQNAAALAASGTAWTNNGGSTVTVSGIGVWSAASGGNLLFFIPITPQSVVAGNGFQLPTDALSLELD